jgi:hypothetical protein
VIGKSITTMQDIAPHSTKSASAMTEVSGMNIVFGGSFSDDASDPTLLSARCREFWDSGSSSSSKSFA